MKKKELNPLQLGPTKHSLRTLGRRENRPLQNPTHSITHNGPDISQDVREVHTRASIGMVNGDQLLCHRPYLKTGKCQDSQTKTYMKIVMRSAVTTEQGGELEVMNQGPNEDLREVQYQ
jgi:hypothetical protein